MANYRVRIPEIVIEGKRLGRHVNHDPRSKRYPYAVRSADFAGLNSVKHNRFIPVLNQGDLGSCTANAGEGAAGTAPLFDAIPVNNPYRPLTAASGADYDENQAVRLYSRATEIDDFLGSYPPDDTGSDGLSVAKAMKESGLISGYQHAFDLPTALAALQSGPVLLGCYWYDSFDTPDSSGLIEITRDASIRGGHEVVLDELDTERDLVWFTNSWGSAWGVRGRACMSWETLQKLLEQDGDIVVPLPLTVPAPTPVPDPGKPDWYVTLMQKLEDLIDWLKSL